jgi:DNA-binding CsgD family transcriptional regulator
VPEPVGRRDRPPRGTPRAPPSGGVPTPRVVRGELTGLQFPACLISRHDLTVRAITESGARFVGQSASAIVGRSISEFFDAEEFVRVRAAMKAIDQEGLTFYRAERRVDWAGAEGGMVSFWTRRIEFDDEDCALVAWLGAPEATYALRALREASFASMAVGLVDAAGFIRSITPEVEAILGLVASTLVGQRIWSKEQQRALDSAHLLAREPKYCSAAAFQIRGPAGLNANCIVSTLGFSTDRLFILIPETDARAYAQARRASELERHLWNIAAEVEASGILVRMSDAPKLALARAAHGVALTPRQWEILRRLASGQRVPTIAAELFITQSTVRGHVSAILDRFNVRSQAELLATLSKSDVVSNETDETSLALRDPRDHP